MASPITSLNPTLAAGWFAGYTQLKIAAPTGGDATDFLALQDYSFYRNRVGKVLLVTALGNLGSASVRGLLVVQSWALLLGER